MRKLGTVATVLAALLALALVPQLGASATPAPQQLGSVGAYLPLVFQVPPTPIATATSEPPTATATNAPPTATATDIPPQPTNPPPTLPPSFNACQADPLASQAPNFPVKIVNIDKRAETVTLRNLSGASVDLTGWTMCSILANQTHPISGSLAPGEERTFPGPAGNIWNNSLQDDGALYNNEGRLVSYFTDTDFVR